MATPLPLKPVPALAGFVDDVRDTSSGSSELQRMAETAQALMQLARTRALAPSMEKTTRSLSLAELSDLLQVPRKTIEYAIHTKTLPAGRISGRKRLFTLTEVAAFRRHFGRIPERPPGTSPAVVGVANFKGGVGKTSTAVHLGQYLALHGYRVLMIDLDAQASLTTLFGLLPDSDVPTEQTALPYFEGSVETLAGSVRKTYWHGLDLIPANLALYNAEFALARRQNAEPGFRFYAVLKEGLDGIGRDYDMIVLDTPPALGFVTTNAMYAANGLVIPITPAMMDFASAAQFFQLLAEHVDVINRHEGGEKRFRFVRLLVSKFEANNKVHETIEEWIRQGFESAVIGKNMALSAALRTGPELQTAYEMGAYIGDRRTLQRAMKFLDDVNEEIEKLIRQQWAQELRQRESAAGAVA
jgi:chromosome partitioning protein